MRYVGLSAFALILCLTSVSAVAQQRVGVTGAGNRTQGLEQTGQLSSAAAIQRNESSFVGGSAGSFLSPTGTTGGVGGGGPTGIGGLGGISGLGGLGGLGGGGLGGFGGGFGGRQQGGLRGSQGLGTTTTPQLRIPIRIGFTPRAMAASVVSSRLSRRLSHIPSLGSTAGVTVSMQGRTAVLAGSVPTDRDRDLVARLALLEPGISDVQNDLVVQSAGTLSAGDSQQ